MMRLKEEISSARSPWKLLTFYQKFEQAVVFLLTGLIAVVVALALWNVIVKVMVSILSSSGFDPTDYSVFQALFGMIFTVIIALEFKRSLLIVAERQHSVVQVRTVVLIALLAIVRKLMIIDLGTTGSLAIVCPGDRHPGTRRGALAGARARPTRPTRPHPEPCGLIRRFAMTTRKLDKTQWRPFLDGLSKLLESQEAEVEVASLQLGGQLEAKWLPFLGIAYDPNDDLVEVALEGVDHMIRKPREISVENGSGALTSLEVVDAEGVKQVVKLRDQLMLPSPLR
jgi:uncharacterized membrane protein (DUF373 family)